MVKINWDVKNTRVSEQGGGQAVYVVVRLAVYLRSPSLKWMPLWRGCFNNQSLSQALLYKERKKEKKNLLGFTANTSSRNVNDSDASLKHLCQTTVNPAPLCDTRWSAPETAWAHLPGRLPSGSACWATHLTRSWLCLLPSPLRLILLVK